MFAALRANAASAQVQSEGGSSTAAAVIPDTEGAIAEIVLHFLLEAAEDLAPTYSDLFESLPPDVALEVLCPSAADAQEFCDLWGAAAAAGGRPVRIVNVNRPITIWARDRRIARQSALSTEPASSFVPAAVDDYGRDKRNELRLPCLLAAGGWSVDADQSDVHLEGGNVVSNRRHVFVGANVYADNRVAYANPAALRAELREILGRDYLTISDRFDNVPYCHVDMYVTPIDDERILVASPALARRLLLSRAADTEAGDGPVPEEVLAALSTGDAALNDIARELAGHGYRVYRVPAVIDPDEEWMITYNNVLMERRDGLRIVYMPTYELPVLDRAAAAVYGALGFQVRTIDVSGIYRDGGAIRCLANVTARRRGDPAHRPRTQTAPRHRSATRLPRPRDGEAEHRAGRPAEGRRS